MITSQTYQNALVCLSDRSQFGNCHFKRCRLHWADGNYEHPAFFNCSFADCDLGMPMKRFAERLTMNSLIEFMSEKTISPRQLAIDKAVRRVVSPEEAKWIWFSFDYLRDDFEYLALLAKAARAEYRKINAH